MLTKVPILSLAVETVRGGGGEVEVVVVVVVAGLAVCCFVSPPGVYGAALAESTAAVVVCLKKPRVERALFRSDGGMSGPDWNIIRAFSSLHVHSTLGFFEMVGLRLDCVRLLPFGCCLLVGALLDMSRVIAV